MSRSPQPVETYVEVVSAPGVAIHRGCSCTEWLNVQFRDLMVRREGNRLTDWMPKSELFSIRLALDVLMIHNRMEIASTLQTRAIVERAWIR